MVPLSMQRMVEGVHVAIPPCIYPFSAYATLYVHLKYKLMKETNSESGVSTDTSVLPPDMCLAGLYFQTSPSIYNYQDAHAQGKLTRWHFFGKAPL